MCKKLFFLTSFVLVLSLVGMVSAQIASEPDPADGAADVDDMPVLTWIAGETAFQHDVYLGTDADLVAAGDASVFQGSLADASFAPADALDKGATYYWKVDVTTGSARASEFHPGNVWSFIVTDVIEVIEPANPGNNGLVAYYAFENDANDSSGNELHGTLVGDAKFAEGPVGYGMALDLDGDGDYVDCGLDPNFDITEQISFTYWMKAVALDKGWNTVLSRGDDSWRSSRAGTENFMEAAVGGTSGNYLLGATLVDDDNWHHVGAVYDGATFSLYVDGKLDASEESTGSITVSSFPLYIGNNSDNMDRDWTGLIDEVTIYNRALSEGEVIYLAGERSTPVDPGSRDLLAFWTCDEGEGAIVGDASGNGRDGTFVNGDPVWVEGVNGSAVELVGPTLIETPPLNMELTEATMAGWIKPNGPQPEWASIIMHRDPGLASGFNILGYQLAYHWGDSSDSWSFRGGDMIAEDDWTFAAVTVDPEKATFYVNGDKGSVNVVAHDPALWDGNVYLGGDGSEGWVDRRMNGALDDVIMYDRALSAGEVRYLAGFRAPPSDVTAPGDIVQGVPNDGLMDGDDFGWPGAETPDLAIDDDTGTKFLHFKGDIEPTGIQVKPASGLSIVTALSLTTANDSPARDPATFELSGSNDSIDGPYELIASGDVVDFTQEAEWPRFTMNATPIEFDNDVAYQYYQLMFPTVRDAAGDNSMQIAEVELLGVSARAGDLMAAFAFGSRPLDCATFNDPAVNYTMVLHESVEAVQYDAARGYGYEVLYPVDSPFGDRAGYGIFGPFDDSPNGRNEFPDVCPEELYDSFIGAKSFTNDVNEATMGDKDTPSPDPEGIIFRVDVPNGLYRFVGAFGEADNGHAHRILAEDGGSGPPENIGANHVVLVHNHDQSQYDIGEIEGDEPGDAVFARVGFDGLIPPPGDGAVPSPVFVDMDENGMATDAGANCPILEVTQGYIRIHQLQGNSNDGPGNSRDANGGDAVILELWKVD